MLAVVVVSLISSLCSPWTEEWGKYLGALAVRSHFAVALASIGSALLILFVVGFGVLSFGSIWFLTSTPPSSNRPWRWHLARWITFGLLILPRGAVALVAMLNASLPRLKALPIHRWEAIPSIVEAPLMPLIACLVLRALDKNRAAQIAFGLAAFALVDELTAALRHVSYPALTAGVIAKRLIEIGLFWLIATYRDPSPSDIGASVTAESPPAEMIS
jgi:hypothetical protein